MSVRRRLADEQGIALVMAVGILAVLSVAVTGMLYFTSTNQRTSAHSKAEVAAIDFAEAGINNALAVLRHVDNAKNLTDAQLLQAPRTTQYPGGSVTWSGELIDVIGQPLVWKLTATGTVRNPTGPGAAAVRRTITARVPLQAPGRTTQGQDIWNWIYTHRTGTPGGCDMSILQSVNLTSPLYVRGNLCLRNGARVARGPLIVGGTLDQQNPQTSVGTSTAPLTTDVKIGTGCRWSNSGDVTAWVTPCRPEPWTPSTKVYVDPSKLVPSGQPNAGSVPSDWQSFQLSPPTVFWAQNYWTSAKGWYEYASPGPNRPCQTWSGTPPVFDTTTVTGAPDGFNNIAGGSVPGVFNLTPPAASYTCWTRDGYLYWNHTTRVLEISGTVFIDGSATVNNNSGPIRYIGQGVVYLTGTLVIKNSNFCAVVASTGNGCDFTTNAWNPNQTLIGFFAFWKGGQISDPTVGIQVVSSQFQGALYAEYAIDASTTTKTQGPMISKTEVRVGQTNENQFPKINIVPLGMGEYGPQFYETLDPALG